MYILSTSRQYQKSSLMTIKAHIQYACAVLLIVSSIALACYQVFDINDIAGGTLIYIAQAFLLAGSIFGLEYYVARLNNIMYGNKQDTERNSE